MNYSLNFEQEINDETEFIKENYYKDCIIAMMSGVLFGIGHFSAIYFCNKFFGKLK